MDPLRAPHPIYLSEQTLVAIMIDKRRRLGLIDMETSLNGLFSIILSLIEVPMTFVTNILSSGRIENHMIKGATSATCPTSC